MIYLDYAASAVPFPEAAREQHRVMLEQFGNPGALHGAAAGPRGLLQEARRSVAALLKVRPEEVFFTSGGTEANNWAVKLGCQQDRRHMVVFAAEHKSVLESARYMQKQGYDLTCVYPDRNGVLSMDTVAAALRPDTGLLCVQAVNNETGVMQDVEALATLARRNGTRFLCDGVQSAGHCDQPLHRADFISLSAHKLGGPRGVGCLVVRYPHSLPPLIHGGGQEYGSRSGTENIPAIAAFSVAVKLSTQMGQGEAQRLRELSDTFVRLLRERIPQLEVNGENAPRHPGIVNCRFPGVTGEEMVMRLDGAGICASPGAACSAGRHEPSHVLLAMGFSRQQAAEAVRFSFGRLTTPEEIGEAAKRISDIYRRAARKES
ncbi:MAG: cysteine desulfurase [Oscillospiraceae bacterium]|nr:cysteine desulfurase [Oscillospiraceae bacterium]